MGFGREARRVRDVRLPHAHRLHALGSCIQRSQPIGFTATWSFLEKQLGIPWRSNEFLLPAIDLLEAERATYLENAATYAEARRRQKASGLRFPRLENATARVPMRWHGDEREGATQTLTAWRRRSQSAKLSAHPHGRLILAVVDEVVRSPRSTVLDPTALQQALDSARGRVHIEGREGDGAHYRVALMLLFVLGQLYLIDNPAPIAGAPWNFTATSGTGTGHHVIRSVLAEPIGIWRTDPKEGTAELVDAATDLLVRGFDSPSLRVLAGTSPREPQAVVGPILTSTLGELGVDDLLRVSADRAGLVARLRRFLDGRLTLRELSFWAHCEIDHDGDPDCQAFVDLDDLYNDWEYAGLDVVRLEAIARREARAFLDGSRPASFDEFWPWLPAAPRRDFFAWWRTVFRRRRAD